MKVDGYCPYCGKEQLETAYWYRNNTYFVRCRNCKATGPSIAHSEEETIKLFNTRHDGPEQGEVGTMTDAERQALDAITRTSITPSGPVMRPTSELVSYAHILERIVGTRYSGFPYHELREYIAPHWMYVFIDMEI